MNLLFLDFTIGGVTPWFPIGALFAFLSMISFFNVNSAWADKIGQPKGNRRFITAGIILALVFILCFWKAATTSTGTGG